MIRPVASVARGRQAARHSQGVAEPGPDRPSWGQGTRRLVLPRARGRRSPAPVIKAAALAARAELAGRVALAPRAALAGRPPEPVARVELAARSRAPAALTEQAAPEAASATQALRASERAVPALGVRVARALARAVAVGALEVAAVALEVAAVPRVPE